ncbi:MAG: tRNA (adenosine(37)-N6)-dimethylallyltransferase MiaA, partial [Lachnospirales bacterium]
TATGKTKVSVDLSKAINGAVVSADSVQVYKYMDIGSAKVKHDEMQGIKHYLVDQFYPDEKFSVAKFQKYATKYINEIYENNQQPILVGGTGFYINSVIYNNDFTGAKENALVRQRYYDIALVKGNEYLHSLLLAIDEKSYKTIHFNNVKRVVRALEFYEDNGYPISTHNAQEKEKKPYYNVKMVILNMDRQILYDRINKRVDIMIAEGLVEEVIRLVELGYKDTLAMTAIGYKQILMYIEGKITLAEAIELVKMESRRFAKRQVTWFKHQNKDNALWVDVLEDSYDIMLEKIVKYISQGN